MRKKGIILNMFEITLPQENVANEEVKSKCSIILVILCSFFFIKAARKTPCFS